MVTVSVEGFDAIDVLESVGFARMFTELLRML
jgi:hypothetical protein